MHFPRLTAFVSGATLALTSPIAVHKRAVTCTKGAVVFLVRGSDAQQTTLNDNPRYNVFPPAMRSVSDAVISKAGGNSYSQAIQYPAINPSTGKYSDSVNIGTSALRRAILDYVNACSTGKIFAIGYSQGGQVVSGALAGSQNTGPLQAMGRCGVILADPAFQDGFFPVDEGSGANNGVDGVLSGQVPYQVLINRFSGRVHSYCEAGDQFCDSGNLANSDTIHQNAPSTFKSDATKFLTNKV